jgi:hypothetical protein
LKKDVEASEAKGKKGPLLLPGDGPMDDVDGALTLPGARKIRCNAAARRRKELLTDLVSVRPNERS